MTRRRSEDLVATRVATRSEHPESVKGSGGIPCLVVIGGDKIGQQVPLTAAHTNIGRDPGCEFPLDGDMISRRHARIEAFNGNYVVVDLQSTNGTYLNDVRTTRGQLADGDRITIGKALLKFLDSGNVEAQYHREIYHLMTYDGLTGIANKRHFEETLRAQVGRATAGAVPVSMLLFDIDHFKSVNDTYGHAAGDAVLRQVAETAKAVVPDSLLLARVGGEEFAVLANGYAMPQLLPVAEAIRAAVQGHTFRFEDQTIPVTTSVGVAERPAGVPESGTDLYKRADEQLYRAKQGGRNRVCS